MAQAKNTSEKRLSHTGVRLDPALLARLEGLRPLYAIPGRAATMTDVLRGVIIAGVEAEERRMAEGGARGT